MSQDISIKSDLGKKPTLLNSSSATNFIFKINNFNTDIDSINNIKTKYKNRDRISYIYELNSRISELVTDENKVCRVKDYLKSVLLGMFSSRKWDGNYTANGSILVRKQGDLVLYHVIKNDILKDYLFYNTKLDTPSSTRHRFGNIYKEGNQYLFKLNLQIRFI